MTSLTWEDDVLPTLSNEEFQFIFGSRPGPVRPPAPKITIDPGTQKQMEKRARELAAPHVEQARPGDYHWQKAQELLGVDADYDPRIDIV